MIKMSVSVEKELCPTVLKQNELNGWKKRQFVPVYKKIPHFPYNLRTTGTLHAKMPISHLSLPR